MNKIFPALLLAAALPAAAQPPQFQTGQLHAEYCPKPAAAYECSEFVLSRPVFPDPAHTAFAEQIVRQTSAGYGLEALTEAAARSELEKRAGRLRETAEAAHPGRQYTANVSAYTVKVSVAGYTPRYLVLTASDYTYEDHQGIGNIDGYVIPRSGKPVPLSLDDILLPGKKSDFAALYDRSRRAYLKAAGLPDPDSRPADIGLFFRISQRYLEKWIFAENGIAYAHNAHYTGAYADPSYFVLPADSLKGIVKPEILRELKAYRPLKN
ncbi:Protein of uncharacterised function (DUF3298) [Kingella potus]|uniref:Protein of uncharacterized function (DUF3298) n=2 Tax=Kingella potus TaxID=265175 RepID=A0A377R381_9NEIS|nr:hypothetical protein [Kingella potus]STR02709.1 Protein of uncharacterised function (DUF3298) [Kingella potus]